MKNIEKQESPKLFEDWKSQEKEILDKYLSEGRKGEELWERLQSSCPPEDRQESDIIYYSKKELRESLLNEQGFICAYCNQIIANNHNTIIEHLKDKSTNPDLTFVYENLLASCNGGQKDPKPKESHCDDAKNDKTLSLTPLDKDCEDHFYFSLDGKIHSKTQEGKQVIDLLNLNIAKLKRLREGAIDGVLFDEELEMITIEDAKILLDNIYKKNNNKFEEFCSAIKSVLEREILNLKENKS